MDFLSFKQEVFNQAKNEGFKDCEIFYFSSKNTSVNVFKGELEKFQNNTLGGISFRGIFNGNMGYSYTEKLSFSKETNLTEEEKANIKNLVISAKENASIITSEDEEFIFSGSRTYPEVKTFYPEIENIEVDEIIGKCLQMEKEVLNFNSLITSCNYCNITKAYSEIFIANTKGLFIKNESNYVFTYVSAVAKKGEHSKSYGDYRAFFDFKDFDHISFAKNVAKNAVDLLGANTLKSNNYKTVIKNDCFADLLQVFVPNFYAENVQKGLSLLKDKIGETVANKSITILDNPLLENALSSSPFDSEGVACYSKSVVENGVLKTYLYNLKSANKDKTNSTGNGFKSSYKSATSTSTTNFYIKNGEVPFEETLKEVGEGVLITSLAGLHSGANPISGDFSLLAEGFVIKNGEISDAVEQITIAGNFYEVLKNVSIISNDLKFNTSSIGSPSVYIGEISISGN